MMLWQKERYEEKNSMFASIRSGKPNILFGAKLRNPAQFASNIPHNFNFFSAPCQKPWTVSYNINQLELQYNNLQATIG